MYNDVLMFQLITILRQDVDYLDIEASDLLPGWNFLSGDFAAKTYKTSGYSIVIL